MTTMFIYSDHPEYETLKRRSRNKLALVFCGLIWRKRFIGDEMIFQAIDVVPNPYPDDDDDDESNWYDE